MVSAIEPARRSVDAVARLLTDEGQKAKEDGSSRSFVIVGSAIVTRPLIKLAVGVTLTSWTMTTTCCRRVFLIVCLPTKDTDDTEDAKGGESICAVIVVVVVGAILAIELVLGKKAEMP